MRLLVDDRWVGMHGIGRFAAEVISRLPHHLSMPGQISPTSPLDPFWTSFQINRFRPEIYFSPGFNAPVWSRSPFVFTIHDLIHLRIESESSLAMHRHTAWMRPAICRVHREVKTSEYS